jgi:hypothetical protein
VRDNPELDVSVAETGRHIERSLVSRIAADKAKLNARPPREPREGNDDGQAPEFAPAFLTGDKED